MIPKAGMVPKDCGFNQSETACGICARIAWRFPCLPATERDGGWTYGNTAFLLSRHNSPSKLTLRNNQTARNVYMWMQQWIIRFFQKEQFSRFLPYAKVARWRHCWIHYLLCLQFRFCSSTMSNIMTIYCKVVQWDMKFVCIAGYCLNFTAVLHWRYLTA